MAGKNGSLFIIDSYNGSSLSDWVVDDVGKENDKSFATIKGPKPTVHKTKSNI